MTELVVDNAYLTINSVNFSDHTRSAQINGTGETQDKTAMGKSARCYLMGLLNAGLAVELNDDLAAGSIDATIYAAYIARVQVAFAYRAVNAAISTTNPEYQGFILVDNYTIGASVGVIGTKSLTWQVSDTITRDTTP